MSLPMQPQSENFFTHISKAGPYVVSHAANLTEFVAAPHERWAALAKRMHDTDHAAWPPLSEKLMSYKGDPESEARRS